MAISRGLAQGVRSGNLFSKRDATVLDAPEQDRAFSPTNSTEVRRKAPVTEMPLRHDSPAPYNDDFDSDDLDSVADDNFQGRARPSGIHLSFRGGFFPRSLWGRIAATCALFGLIAACIAAGFAVRSFLLHDEHFVIASSDSIQIIGNSRLTRPQLLSIFGEDVERSVFNVPLAQRRAQLESLPWVEHATVMRLLPNRIRISIVERTPIAFVRQGSEIGLVDANGVLLNLPTPDAPSPDPSGTDQQDAAALALAAPHYSFPVLTGISASDPLSTRAARMKIYTAFVAALDASGENISRRLSEVDVTYPEDVKAIISDPGSSDPATGNTESATGRADILIHFGDSKFLDRYHQYEQHLAEWRAQYPRLASVDMRYERQVVLEMQSSQSEATAAANAAATNAASPADVPATPSATATAPTVSKAKVEPPKAAQSHSAAAKSKLPAKEAKLTAATKPRPLAAAKSAPHPVIASNTHAAPLATGKVALRPSTTTPQGALR